MELLYVWIEDYNCIKNQGFNFSPRYQFSFEPTYDGKLIRGGNLTKKDLEPTIEDNFFGKHISNITAIVGKNGTGKSSIIDYIFSFKYINLSKLTKLLKFVFLFSNNEFDFFVHSNIDIISMDKKEYKYDDDNYCKTILNNASFIYFSYDFSNYIYCDYRYFDYRESINKSEGNNIDISSSYFLHKYGRWETSNIEVYNQLNSILNHDYLDELRINKPKELEISIRTTYSLEEKNECKKKIMNFFNEGLSDKKILCNALLIMTLYENVLHEDNDLLEEKMRDIFLTKIQQKKPDIGKLIIDYLDEIIKLSKHTKSLQKTKELIEQILNFNDYFLKNNHIQIKRAGGVTSENIVSTAKFVINLTKENKYNKDLIGNLCSLFKNVNQTFGNSKTTVFAHKYIRLSWWQFSSGEQAMLSTWSRLYNIKDDVNKNIILLIDEGELNLHPEWQKRYINDLIDLLKNVFPDKKIQIILTSHSSFIISDLLKENVIFLDKDDNGYCKVVSGIEKQQTFGANIHTLLADAFFLDGGLMGDFAKQKINAVITDLKADKPTQAQIEHAEKIIDLIGEPVLRMKMLQLLNSVKNNRA